MLLPHEPGLGLLISRDLFFTSKITGTAGQLGLVVDIAADYAAATARIATANYRCVFVDLAQPESGLGDFIASLPSERRPTVIAFGSHVATARLQAAREAGCDEVFPRSRFSAELPELLGKLLSPS